MRRMGTQCGMRRIYCPMKSNCRFTLNWMQRIQDEPENNLPLDG